jgi:hypothetical protein
MWASWVLCLALPASISGRLVEAAQTAAGGRAQSVIIGKNEERYAADCAPPVERPSQPSLGHVFSGSLLPCNPHPPPRPLLIRLAYLPACAPARSLTTVTTLHILLCATFDCKDPLPALAQNTFTSRPYTYRRNHHAPLSNTTPHSPRLAPSGRCRPTMRAHPA